MWERTLQDLIRGLRANKKDESKFIAQAIDEIRQEIKSKDMELKAAAVLKLTYLDMLGYDMSWASFYVVEVMSSPKIHLKSIGYLAASQSFDKDTDVLMLTTNLLKKDLNSKPEDVAITLNGLSHIVTADLARDLSQDLIAMLNHSRPNIRKRAVIALYKASMKYPELASQSLPRLREKLEDSDAGVVAATINVLCEFAQRNPRDYLPLAPQLFHLLTTSSNNWMLIKIIKLFGTLTPHEPRLAKKLQPPITDLISTTPAISLLYECVHTCIIGGMLQVASGTSLARTCVSKLAGFLQDSDQNLKYIALLAMVKIVPSHPELVAEYQDMIMSSVDDQDISIRMRALDLVSAMVNPNSLQAIVQQLLSHLVRSESSALPSAAQFLSQYTSTSVSVPKAPTAPSQSPAYRLTLCQRILLLCSQNMYENVIDFEWYLSVLVDLAYVAAVDVGAQIRDQLMDVTARVRATRRYAVQLMVKLLSDDSFHINATETGSCSEVLWAAAYISGEYCSELAEPQKLLSYLLQAHISALSPDIIAVYLQAAMKVFGYWAADLADRWDDNDLPKVKSAVEMILERTGELAAHEDIEVQERAANTYQLFTFVNADLNSYRPKQGHAFEYSDTIASGFDPVASIEPQFPKSLFLIRPLFGSYELNPVALTAQESVPVPDGLDLDSWIVPPPKEAPTNGIGGATEDADEKEQRKSRKGKGKETKKTKSKGKKRTEYEEDSDHAPIVTPQEETDDQRAERERVKAERLERLKDDPFYLIDEQPKAARPVDDIDSIPVVRLDDMLPLQPAPINLLPSLRSPSTPVTPQTFVIDRTGEMPENAVSPAARSRNSGSPVSMGNGQSVTASSSFYPPYEVEDEIPRTGTPQPIKVTRAKKKGTSGGKKKRTVKAESTPPQVD